MALLSVATLLRMTGQPVISQATPQTGKGKAGSQREALATEHRLCERKESEVPSNNAGEQGN